MQAIRPAIDEKDNLRAFQTLHPQNLQQISISTPIFVEKRQKVSNENIPLGVIVNGWQRFLSWICAESGPYSEPGLGPYFELVVPI
jgi:hypothetical protein